MSADNRTVATDALATLGTIIGEGEKRDAIHLAVEPATAAHTLRPGEDVGRLPDGRYGVGAMAVGIVDPFLKTVVQRDQKFWLVVYPRQVTSLRHVWSHPAFEDEPVSPAQAGESDKVRAAKEWLREYARELELSYDELMDGASLYLDRGDRLYGGSNLEGERTRDEFWDYYQEATGRMVRSNDRGNFFSCSC